MTEKEYIESLEEALLFYATEANYENGKILAPGFYNYPRMYQPQYDMGRVARLALSKKDPSGLVEYLKGERQKMELFFKEFNHK